MLKPQAGSLKAEAAHSTCSCTLPLSYQARRAPNPLSDLKKPGARATNLGGRRQTPRGREQTASSAVHSGDSRASWGLRGFAPTFGTARGAEQRGSGLCPWLSTTPGFPMPSLLHFSALNSLSLLSSPPTQAMQIALIKAKDSHYATNLFSDHGCTLFFPL